MTAAWESALESARALGDTDAGRSALAEICLAYSEVTRDHLFTAPVAGRPPGRPTRQAARAAAALLTAATSPQGSRREARQHILGLITSHAKPTSVGEDVAAGALGQAIGTCQAAAVLAEDRGETDLRVMALHALCKLHRQNADFDAALAAAQAARECAAAGLAMADDDWGPADAAGRPAWLEPAAVYRRVLAVLSARAAARVAAAAGRYDLWTDAVGEQLALAEPLLQVRRRLYAQSLQQTIGLARARGDRDAFAAVEERLTGDLAELRDAEDVDALRRTLDSARVGNAEALKDWQRCVDLGRERLAYLVERVSQRAAARGDDVPPRVDQVLEWLHPLGDRAWTASIGNAALSTATALYRLGLTATDPARYQEAHALLDTAFRAYRGYGSNGFVAITLTRARLRNSAPGGPAQPLAETIAQFLDVSRRGQAAALRRNAVIDAARLCEPTDHRVLKRIDEMLAADRTVYPFHLRAARVICLRRQASSEESWRGAEREALRAAEGLEPGDKLIDPMLAADCWAAAAEAARHIPERPPAERLQRLLSAVRCLAIQFLTVTSTRERADLGRRYGGLLAAAADLAADLGDAEALELVMEALRRDRTGLLLADLARDQRVSDAVRAAAERVLAANSAAPGIPADLTSDDEVRAWVAPAAEDIGQQRHAAASAASAVIGPLAALTDIAALTHISSADVLRAATPGRPAAVLQLMAGGAGFLQAQDPVLYWALTWTSGRSDIHQDCGRQPLPSHPSALTADSPTFWADVYHLAGTLLPAPLREFLAACGPSNPALLTVIPTGLHGVPFDCLPVDEERGLQVVDCASVVVTGSMAVSHALSRLSAPGDDAEWLAVFDVDALAHTEQELRAMERHHQPVTRLRTSADFFRALADGDGPASSVLAMGVHGSVDSDTGWGQAKRLPDGAVVRAVDILRWRVPRQCVLASCHSTLIAHAGVELSGFPMAMLLRGARTVIGSLHEIFDEATSQIMEVYWAQTGGGASAAEALRAAKLAWLAADPSRRACPDRWAGLIAYGAP